MLTGVHFKPVLLLTQLLSAAFRSPLDGLLHVRPFTGDTTDKHTQDKC